MKMTWTTALLAGCFTLLVGTAACGDDTDKKTDTTTTAADTTSSPDGDVVEEVSPVTNACTNAPDQAKLAEDPDAPADIAQSCGISCLGEDDGTANGPALIRACALDCMVNGRPTGTTPIPAAGLTESCSGCYADVVLCAVKNCINQCLDGGADCDQCRVEKGCNAAFYTCSGLPEPTE